MRTDWRAVARLVLLTSLTTTSAGGVAQEPDADTRWPSPTEPALGRTRDDPGAEDIGWSNATELSVVRTHGNAETQTFGFKNTLRRNWTGARARLRVDGIRARASGDRFLVVAPGLRFRPGARVGASDSEAQGTRSATGGQPQYGCVSLAPPAVPCRSGRCRDVGEGRLRGSVRASTAVDLVEAVPPPDGRLGAHRPHRLVKRFRPDVAQGPSTR